MCLRGGGGGYLQLSCGSLARSIAFSALFLPRSKYQDILIQKELDMAGAPHIPKGTTDNARQLSGKEVFVGAAVIMIGVLIFVWAISEFAI